MQLVQEMVDLVVQVNKGDVIMGILGTITLILLILKLFSIITIEWWQVFIPMYIWLFLVIRVYIKYYNTRKSYRNHFKNEDKGE